MIQNFDQDMAASFGFDSTEGALIGDVNPGSPAEKGGLRQGDIVLEFAEQKIVDVNQLRNLVAAVVPNQTVNVTVFRGGNKIDLSVKVGEQEASKEVDNVKPEASVSENVGLSLRNITPDVVQELNFKTWYKGRCGGGSSAWKPGSASRNGAWRHN